MVGHSSSLLHGDATSGREAPCKGLCQFSGWDGNKRIDARTSLRASPVAEGEPDRFV